MKHPWKVLYPECEFKDFLEINQSETRMACLLMDRDEMSNLYRGPAIDASYQVLLHLAKGFQRRRLKCEKLTDDGRLHFQQYISYIIATSFSGEGSRKEQLTTGKQLVNFITCGCESTAPFLAHLAKGNVSSCRHLASVFRRPSSVNFSHFNLLL
jgi:hypothetical protein